MYIYITIFQAKNSVILRLAKKKTIERQNIYFNMCIKKTCVITNKIFIYLA